MVWNVKKKGYKGCVTMKVVDLRNIFCQLQRSTDRDQRQPTSIMQRKKKRKDTTVSSFLEYNRITKQEHLSQLYFGQARWAPFFSFSDIIFMVLEDGSSHIERFQSTRLPGKSAVPLC